MPLEGMAELKAALNEIAVEKNTELKAVFFQGLSNIQIGTPVLSGRAKNNWFESIGSPSRKTTNAKTCNTISPSDMPDWVLGKTLYYTNNLPYIAALEYDGHSKQAPMGWVRGEILRIRRAIRGIQ